MAELDANQGAVPEAVARLRRALASRSLPRQQVGRLAKKLGDFSRMLQAYAEAIRWYEETQELAPAMAGEAAYRAASCFEEAGDVDVAIVRYLGVEDPAWRVRAQLAAAKLLERQERWPDAERIYEALAAQPIPEAKMAQESLAQLRDRGTMHR
jgi:tetratricopeptide (TPR) repeat protein